MKKQTEFRYNQRNLAVTATLENGTWSVRVFEGNQPANGVVYNVTAETAGDALKRGLDIVGDLMTTAQRDFTEWSDWMKRPQTTK